MRSWATFAKTFVLLVTMNFGAGLPFVITSCTFRKHSVCISKIRGGSAILIKH